MSNTLPETMRCIEIPEPGKSVDALKLSSRALPTAGDNEILVRVSAAGVNRPDLAQRRGNYPPPPGVTDIPGLEVAGEVVATGTGVTDWKSGDSVTALVAGGGYAEYCVVPAPQALPIPTGFSMIEAAALPETFFTVWVNVFDRCSLQPGETFLVHGGTSGIGTSAIMLASQLGSTVIATAGSDEKCQACLDLGASLAINYKTQDFAEEAKKFTDGKGVDVILDMVAGDYIQRDIECLAEDGRIGVIATLGGAKADIDVGMFFRKRMTLTGSTLRARSVAVKQEIAIGLREHVWPLLDSGKVKPQIHATCPLDKAAEAHQILETGDHIGKVVLTVEN